jgi:hypothetical protein
MTLAKAMLVLVGLMGSVAAQETRVEAVVAPKDTDEAERAVWAGYLWRDSDGRLRIGTPLSSTSSGMRPPRRVCIVAEPLASALAPFVSKVDDSTFQFDQAVAGDEKLLATAPRILVRLLGVESTSATSATRVALSYKGDRYLLDARLLSIETIDDAWLAAWRAGSRNEGSVWTEGYGLSPDDRLVRMPLLQKRVASLTAMIAVPESTDDVLAQARTIDAMVVRSTSFRRRTERELQRDIKREARQLGMRHSPVPDLPPLPPTAEDAQRWLIEEPTRAGFLARAAKEWKGKLDDLCVEHNVVEPNTIAIMDTELTTIRDAWTDERYVKNRAATIDWERRSR